MKRCKKNARLIVLKGSLSVEIGTWRKAAFGQRKICGWIKFELPESGTWLS
jgi:hypothetical protein